MRVLLGAVIGKCFWIIAGVSVTCNLLKSRVSKRACNTKEPAGAPGNQGTEAS